MNALEELTESFSRLPESKKSATRIAVHILKTDESYAQNLAQQLLTLHERIILFYLRCLQKKIRAKYVQTLQEKEIFGVVEQPQDVQTIEASRVSWAFSCSGGVIAPLEGMDRAAIFLFTC